MAGRQEILSSRLKVGVLMLVALTAVVALFFLLSGRSVGFLGHKFTVRAFYKNAAGLKVGSPVNLDGITIGSVRAIRIVSKPALTPVEVTMAINSKYQKNLLTDSRANINTIGVLGSTEIDINNVVAHGQPIANHGVLLTGGTPNLEDAMRSFQKATQKLNTTLGKVNVLVSHLGSNKGSIGMLINDPTLRNRASKTVNEFSAIPAQLNAGKGSIGKFVKEDSLTNHVKDMQAKITGISTAVNHGQGSVGKFMKDPALKQNLKETSSQFHQLSKEVQSGQGAVGMMVKNEEFKKKLQDTGQQLSALKTQTGADQGTLGQLMNNPSLGKVLRDLVSNSRELATGIRKHPLKYVKLRFRLF